MVVKEVKDECQKQGCLKLGGEDKELKIKNGE